MRIRRVSSRSKDSLSVVVFCYMLMCVGCFGLVVSTCQMIGWKDPSEDTLTWKRVYVCIFLLFGLSTFLCVPPPALHNIYISYAYDTHAYGTHDFHGI